MTARPFVLALSLLLPALLAPPAAAGQDDDAEWLERCREQREGGRTSFCEVRTEGLPATGVPLSIDGGRNGGAAVAGWDRDSIDVRARVQVRARSAEEARRLAERIRVDVSADRIEAVGPEDGDGASWSVVFHVRVPARSDLTLEAQNGPVSVQEVSGRLDLRTQNGPIHLEEAGGTVVARAQNGPIHVTLGGNRWEGTGLDAETRNGPIHLEIPAGYNARLETGTVHGPLDVDFPLTVTLDAGTRGRRFSTTLGDGGPPIRVVTRNGPVHIGRR